MFAIFCEGVRLIKIIRAVRYPSCNSAGKFVSTLSLAYTSSSHKTCGEPFSLPPTFLIVPYPLLTHVIRERKLAKKSGLNNHRQTSLALPSAKFITSVHGQQSFSSCLFLPERREALCWQPMGKYADRHWAATSYRQKGQTLRATAMPTGDMLDSRRERLTSATWIISREPVRKSAQRRN